MSPPFDHRNGHVLLVVLGAEADAPLGAALLLHRLGGRLQVVPRRGRFGDAGLLGDVGALVEHARLDVPRHAIGGAVDDVRVPGAFEERRRVDVVADRLEGAGRHELAHHVGAHLADVGRLPAADRGLQPGHGLVPRNRRDLDGHVRVLLHEQVGHRAEELALIAHGPDLELARGLARGAGSCAAGCSRLPSDRSRLACAGAASAGIVRATRGRHDGDRRDEQERHRVTSHPLHFDLLRGPHAGPGIGALPGETCRRHGQQGTRLAGSLQCDGAPGDLGGALRRVVTRRGGR